MESKSRYFLSILGWLFLAICVCGSIKFFIFDPLSKPQVVRTAEEIRKERIDEQFSSWDGSHKKLTRLIKSNMHNPDSFKHVKTYRYDKSEYGKGDLIHVRTIYRGTNLFNAIVTNTVEADVDMEGNVVAVTKQD